MALVFLLTAWMQRATAQSNSESDLKAMFIYNFVKYVEWPPSGGSSFRIGVVGDSPVSDALRKVAEQKRALGKPIEVVTLAPGQWTDVHVLFIVGNTAVEDAIAHYNNRAALIITESNRRMPKGSMINLINRDNKIRFELNLIEAKESNLRIASQLANLADKVIQ